MDRYLIARVNGSGAVMTVDMATLAMVPTPEVLDLYQEVATSPTHRYAVLYGGTNYAYGATAVDGPTLTRVGYASSDNSVSFNLVNAACISADGRYLALGITKSPYLRVADLTTNTFVSLSSLPATTIGAVGFSPDGTRLVALSKSSALAPQVYETATWTKVTGPSTAVSGGALGFNPDGSRLTVTGVFSNGAKLQEYNVSNWSLTSTYADTSTALGAPLYTTDGAYILAPVNGNIVRRINTSSWSYDTPITDFGHIDAGYTKVIGLSLAGDYLAVGHVAKQPAGPILSIYKTSDWSLYTTFYLGASDGSTQTTSVAFVLGPVEATAFWTDLLLTYETI